MHFGTYLNNGYHNHTDEEIKKFYDSKNIAVVGMSKNEEKPAHLY